MKQCTKCNKSLPLENFGKCGLTPKGTQRYRAECISCQAIRDQSRKDIRNENTLKRDRENKALVLEHLKSNPCVDCGESDPIVLEFDHVRGDKVKSISMMIQRHYPLQKLKDEVDKCEVRCANCHRKVTANRSNYWKNALI